MTKERYIKFTEKETAFIKQAIIASIAFVAIFIILIFAIGYFKVWPYFLSFVVVIGIMAMLYYYVFSEYLIYVVKLNEFKRIQLKKDFKINNEVIEYFNSEVYKNLYDDDFSILQKNDVYTLTSSGIEGSNFTLGFAVCFSDNVTEEINPSSRDLSNELSSYMNQTNIIKVILLVKETFKDEELEELTYNSAIHKNTLVIGLEKSSNTLIYNYFLNGNFVDVFLGEIFQVDLKR